MHIKTSWELGVVNATISDIKIKKKNIIFYNNAINTTVEPRQSGRTQTEDFQDNLLKLLRFSLLFSPPSYLLYFKLKRIGKIIGR